MIGKDYVISSPVSISINKDFKKKCEVFDQFTQLWSEKQKFY